MTPSTWLAWAFCVAWITGITLAASFGGEIWVTRAIGALLLPAALVILVIAVALIGGLLK